MERPVDVMNLETGDFQTFVGPTPREAVIAAYAQSKGDYNTWDYGKYDELVMEGNLCYSVEDFSAYKDGRRMLE